MADCAAMRFSIASELAPRAGNPPVATTRAINTSKLDFDIRPHGVGLATHPGFWKNYATKRALMLKELSLILIADSPRGQRTSKTRPETTGSTGVYRRKLWALSSRRTTPTLQVPLAAN